MEQYMIRQVGAWDLTGKYLVAEGEAIQSERQKREAQRTDMQILSASDATKQEPIILDVDDLGNFTSKTINSFILMRSYKIITGDDVFIARYVGSPFKHLLDFQLDDGRLFTLSSLGADLYTVYPSDKQSF